MDNDKKPVASENRSIFIDEDVTGENVIIGENNSINQTFIQKFFNIFKSDAETLEQRNRRILLNHVENAWIKGVLDASLHGAALLDLGIKQDPEAVTKYPWTLKMESTDETLPAGTSMLEIFDSIGMGRSLLILGAPGSGKTTMLLELTRQLIACAREDFTQPIPMVFNLASWTENLTLANWLAQELNNLYSVPRKTAPDWVKGNKLLLLLDGLDEVRQESRSKCVEAINEFRKQNGLTSLAVCSRSQDYADIKAKLAFEGAIEVQPLTQGQIAEFFNRFGKEMAGIKKALEKDSALREMVETPLFLSIMFIAFQNKEDAEILIIGDLNVQRQHLFTLYIEQMFERQRSNTPIFNKQNLMQFLSWLARKMLEHDQTLFLVERLQPNWLEQKRQFEKYEQIKTLVVGITVWLITWLIMGLFLGWIEGLIVGLFFGLVSGLNNLNENHIETVDALTWNKKKGIWGFFEIFDIGSILVLSIQVIFGPSDWLFVLLIIWLIIRLSSMLNDMMKSKQIENIKHPEERLFLSAKNFLVGGLIGTLSGVLSGMLSNALSGQLRVGLIAGPIVGLIVGLLVGLRYGGMTILQHYTLRLILAHNNLLPWRLVPFLDHCVDLIFLRRVGGGFIFVHRLLMEHFAEMYVETPTSKGN